MSAPAAIAGPMDMKARAAAVQSDIKSYDLDTLGDDTVGVSSRFTTDIRGMDKNCGVCEWRK